jgi:putative endonuclease
MFYVYVLHSKSKDKFYIGYTSDLRKRIKVHKSYGNHTTKRLGDIELVYYEASKNESDARLRERQLKTGFGRSYLRKRIDSYLKLNNNGIAAIV